MSRGMPGQGQGLPAVEPERPSFGQRLENYFSNIGGLDVGGLQVGQDFTEEERNLARNRGLQQFLYALSAGARGEDPLAAGLELRRVQEQQQLTKEQKKKQEELQKELNKAIDESKLPESQKKLLKQLDVKTQASILFREPEPEPGKQEIIDGILRKIERGESLTAQEQQLYRDLVLRPTPQERLLEQFQFGGSSQSQPGPSIIPPNFIGTSDEWNQLKDANPNVSDEALVNWYNEKYGS